MDKLIIAGVDTILGGNMAAWLSDRFEIIGLTSGPKVQIAGCKTTQIPSRDPQAIQAWMAAERPDWLVYCGPWTESAWTAQQDSGSFLKATESVLPWVKGAQSVGCASTVISSDAVFTGPWMFHDEASDHFCATPAAQSLRQMEEAIAAISPSTMVVRSHVFGWSPLAQTEGFIEQTLSHMYAGRRLNLDCVRHATPILATDLAEVLEQAYSAGLTGLYHIGGAERLNPYRLGTLLANAFGCPYTPAAPLEPLTERCSQFGSGETSLQSLKIRKSLGCSLPLISEGLERLHAQSLNGYRDQFGSQNPQIQEQLVA